MTTHVIVVPRSEAEAGTGLNRSRASSVGSGRPDGRYRIKFAQDGAAHLSCRNRRLPRQGDIGRTRAAHALSGPGTHRAHWPLCCSSRSEGRHHLAREQRHRRRRLIERHGAEHHLAEHIIDAALGL